MTSELERLCEKRGVKATATETSAPADDTWMSGSTHWRVTLRFGKKQLTVPFHQGPAICKGPGPADVLYCLYADASSVEGNNFESWCGDLGYDVDSRKAEALFKACRKIELKLRKFLGEHYEEFCRSSH